MTDHPITPSPELVREWVSSCSPYDPPCDHIATQAARWGADQELRACVLKLDTNGCPGTWIDMLRAARRSKPPSLKEQALEMLECIPTHDNSGRENGIDLSVIRRALEALPE